MLSGAGACVLGLEGFLTQKSVLAEPSARRLSARDQVCKLRLWSFFSFCFYADVKN